MSRWALFAAHRSARGGASVPRVVGADGRELRRPWRITAPAVSLQVRQLRAQRRQPAWPRLLGMLLLGVAGMACVAALHPEVPIPRHVAGSSSARTGPGLLPLQLVSPAGDVTAPVEHFVWRGEAATGTHSLVLCDASYAEIARVDGIGGDRCPVTPRLAELFAGAGTFHWYVEATAAHTTARSTFETFTIR